MRHLVIAALCALALHSLAAESEDDFTNHVFVAITNGVLDRYSLTVDFATELPPPYLVGIFDSLDAQFLPSPRSRSFPVNYKVVGEKSATLACDTRRLPYTVFVQVLPASWTNTPGFRLLSPAEVVARHATTPTEEAIEFAETLLAGVGYRYEACYPPVSLCRGCSQEVPLSRPFRSLSVRDGWRIGLDWLGRPRRIAAPTNAVPGRIYWEGVQ